MLTHIASVLIFAIAGGAALIIIMCSIWNEEDA